MRPLALANVYEGADNADLVLQGAVYGDRNGITWVCADAVHMKVSEALIVSEIRYRQLFESAYEGAPEGENHEINFN
jgi:hypothetical protein